MGRNHFRDVVIASIIMFLLGLDILYMAFHQVP